MSRPSALLWRTAVPVVVALATLLMVTTAHTSGGTDLRASRSVGLDSAVRAEQQTLSDLSRQQAALSAAIAADTTARATTSERVAAATGRADALSAAAGLTPVTGSAVRVSLDDVPRSMVAADEQAGASPDSLVIHQQDVQGVVNALWSGGATAMTVMGQRLISTSAVRCVGNTLLLDGRVFSPPYTIVATGNPVELAEALGASADVQVFREYVAAYGLGYRQQTVARVTLPAYSGDLGVGLARPEGAS